MAALGMMQIHSTSLEQTHAIGRRIGEVAVLGDVIALDGELGAGKTQLVRGLAHGMGLDPAHVSSPTFVLMHEYENENNNEEESRVLVHIDAYRLSTPAQLASLGFDAALRRCSVTAIEWSQKILADPQPGEHSPLGPAVLHILLQHRPGDTRQLTITPSAAWRERLENMNFAAR